MNQNFLDMYELSYLKELGLIPYIDSYSVYRSPETHGLSMSLFFPKAFSIRIYSSCFGFPNNERFYYEAHLSFFEKKCKECGHLDDKRKSLTFASDNLEKLFPVLNEALIDNGYLELNNIINKPNEGVFTAIATNGLEELIK